MSEAHNRATAKWAKQHVENLTVKLLPSAGITKEDVKRAAEREGLSVNAFIIECIKDKL